MSTVAFDTHRFIKHLTESGFTEQQAEALAEEQTDLLNGNLATKADLGKLEFALKGDIERLEFALKGDIERLELAHKGDTERLEFALKGDIERLELAHKGDTERLEFALKGDIERLEIKLEAKIVQAKYETIKWTIGIVLAVAALQTTVIVQLLS